MTAAERAREEGRRAGLREAASLIGQRAAKFRGDENALVFATNLRLHILSLAGPAQVRLDGGEEAPGDGDELNQRAWICMIAHLQARQKFFQEERGHYQPPTPAAVAEVKKEIRAALVRHHETGGDREKWRRESAVLAAGVGVFYAPELNGEMDREEHWRRSRLPVPLGWLPKIHLELWRAWKPQKGKPDPALRYAELCFERRREVAGG